MDKRINLNKEVWSARALNTAPDSENQIHGDDMAREFGFRGGLVPGGWAGQLHLSKNNCIT